MKKPSRIIAAIFAASALVLLVGEIGVAQAHHSTAHSIGTKPAPVNP